MLLRYVLVFALIAPSVSSSDWFDDLYAYFFHDEVCSALGGELDRISAEGDHAMDLEDSGGPSARDRLNELADLAAPLQERWFRYGC